MSFLFLLALLLGLLSIAFCEQENLSANQTEVSSSTSASRELQSGFPIPELVFEDQFFASPDERALAASDRTILTTAGTIDSLRVYTRPNLITPWLLQPNYVSSFNFKSPAAGDPRFTRFQQLSTDGKTMLVVTDDYSNYGFWNQQRYSYLHIFQQSIFPSGGQVADLLQTITIKGITSFSNSRYLFTATVNGDTLIVQVRAKDGRPKSFVLQQFTRNARTGIFEFERNIPNTIVEGSKGRYHEVLLVQGGDLLLVGNPDDDYLDVEAGAFYIFRKRPLDGRFVQWRRVLPPAPPREALSHQRRRFGSALAANDKYFVIGADWKDPIFTNRASPQPAAYVYSARPPFRLVTEITIPDPYRRASERGRVRFDVAIEKNDMILISEPSFVPPGFARSDGRVSLFVPEEVGSTRWRHRAALVPRVRNWRNGYDLFGNTLALVDGPTAVINAAQGGVYTYNLARFLPPTKPRAPVVGSVTGLTLVNAFLNEAMGTIENGSFFDTATVYKPLTVRAETTGTVGKVVMELYKDGSLILSRTDVIAPYYLSGPDQFPQRTSNLHRVPEIEAGHRYMVVATPYPSRSSPGGEAGKSFVRSFRVVRKAFAVQRLSLYNADTNKEIGPLINGSVYSFGAIGTRSLTVRAYTEVISDFVTVGSVAFDLNGIERFRVDSTNPFSLGLFDYTPVTELRTAGTKVVSATPYRGSGGRGVAGVTWKVQFELLE